MHSRNLFVFLFLIIFNSTFLLAQQSFVVEYEQISIPRFLKSDGTEEKLNKDLLESLAQPTFYELQIKDKQSFYSKVERINNSQAGTSVIMFGVLPKNLFLDFEQNIQKREWEVETKKYIVVGSIETEKFQLTREKSTYLGYDVKQAIKESEYGKTVIWYAPDLPAKLGPSTFINLPGLVLKVESYRKDSDEVSFSLKATSIQINDKLKFGQLFKGKEISETEFKTIKENHEKGFTNDPQGVDKS